MPVMSEGVLEGCSGAPCFAFHVLVFNDFKLNSVPGLGV